MEIPSGLPIADPHSNAELQGKDYEHKFEQLPEDQKLSKLCSDALLKIVEKGQFFITLDEEEGPNEMKNQCREFSLPRSEEASRVKGWILGNKKVGPVLDVKVCLHQKTLRYRNHGRISVSVNVRNKHVTETSETISVENVEHRVTGKPVAKAKPRPMLTVTLSPISTPVRERNWIDIIPERFLQDCFTVSKAMIRLLRHDPSIPREDDGAVRFDDTMEKSRRSSMVLRNGQLTIGELVWQR